MRLILVLAASLALAACRDPAPLPDDPPAPQAAASTDATQLRDAIQEPIDKAKAVEATQAADEAERQKALQDAGG
ncbi:hypothetical protein [Arenimonas sp. MALMAid1274]|uniref:hypothetical protein n=1 Tax=Arenimonas sp. MALMAid1274 TaxID=3411630 RepID=UPI003BA1637E